MTRPARFLLLLLLALPAAAQQPWFPDDYKTPPCTPEGVCESFPTETLAVAAGSYLGLNLNPSWVNANDAAMRERIAPSCRKIAACYASGAPTSSFCNDVQAVEIRAICPRLYAKGSNDLEQCQAYVEIFALGVDRYSRAKFKATQECLKTNPPAMRTTPPKVWFEPATIPHGYTGDIRILALDPETNIPVAGTYKIADQMLFSKVNPSGALATFYPFKWPTKWVRVPNADGHTDVVAPTVTLTFEHYPEMKFPLPATPPKLTAEMQPPTLKPGRNKVTVVTKDATTGEPVETRVMYGDLVIGDSNTPVVIDVKKGAKRKDVWVTSLFDAYSDVVVLKP